MYMILSKLRLTTPPFVFHVITTSQEMIGYLLHGWAVDLSPVWFAPAAQEQGDRESTNVLAFTASNEG